MGGGGRGLKEGRRRVRNRTEPDGGGAERILQRRERGCRGGQICRVKVRGTRKNTGISDGLGGRVG